MAISGKAEESLGDSLEQEQHRLYLEFVVWATCFGLVFPVLFVFFNNKRVPQSMTLLVMAALIFVATVVFNVLASGTIFPRLGPAAIRVVLYSWGLCLLVLAALLVQWTGGLQSSIFVWLFEYAVVVSLILSPKSGGSFYQNWRPALLTIALETVIVLALMYVAPNSPSVPHMPFWGGMSVVNSLLISLFLFWFSSSKLQRRAEDA